MADSCGNEEEDYDEQSFLEELAQMDEELGFARHAVTVSGYTIKPRRGREPSPEDIVNDLLRSVAPVISTVLSVSTDEKTGEYFGITEAVFTRKVDADKAIKELSGYKIDGKVLQVRSGGENEEQVKAMRNRKKR